MVIVGNSMILRKFKMIKEFIIDLGESITKNENIGDASHPNYRTVIKIKDPFINKYYNLYGNYIYKHGKIGSLNIYCDDNMNNNILSFYTDDDNVFDIKYGNENFREFLNDSLEDVMNKNKEAKQIKEQNNNSTESVKSTKNMSQEELIEYLLKKRNM